MAHLAQQVAQGRRDRVARHQEAPGMRKGARLAADAAGLRALLAQEESLGAA
jgi:hypothetical protein